MQILLISSFFFFLAAQCNACQISWTSLYANTPQNGFEAIPYDELNKQLHELTVDGNLYVSEGASILLLCQNGKRSRQICLNNKFTLHWQETACTEPQTSKIRIIRNSPRCLANEQHITVYIDVQELRIDLYELCFNEISMSTREVIYRVQMGSNAVFYNLPRPTDRWSSEQYQQFLVPKAYTRKQQILNIAQSFEGGIEYWKQQSLQRGHLCTFTAFTFFSARNATCEYMNNSPQWESVNLGNIAKIEQVFAQVSSQNGHLDVTHIHYQQLQLKDISGKDHDISLLPEARLVEVPKYILKYARDPITGIRYVFVVLNNPFLDAIPEAPCQPQTNSIFWRPDYFRTNTRSDIVDGYTWLCFASSLNFVSQTI